MSGLRRYLELASRMDREERVGLVPETSSPDRLPAPPDRSRSVVRKQLGTLDLHHGNANPLVTKYRRDNFPRRIRKRPLRTTGYHAVVDLAQAGGRSPEAQEGMGG